MRTVLRWADLWRLLWHDSRCWVPLILYAIWMVSWPISIWQDRRRARRDEEGR